MAWLCNRKRVCPTEEIKYGKERKGIIYVLAAFKEKGTGKEEISSLQAVS
jgi:hypothetical protein